jgi:hypothetical protein
MKYSSFSCTVSDPSAVLTVLGPDQPRRLSYSTDYFRKDIFSTLRHRAPPLALWFSTAVEYTTGCSISASSDVRTHALPLLESLPAAVLNSRSSLASHVMLLLYCTSLHLRRGRDEVGTAGPGRLCIAPLQ